jgi:adenylate cyclase
MPEERVRRRLAAILAADVAGYSRLMGEDEAGTHAALRALRAGVIDPQATAHGGRLFKTTGDGFLIEFPSAVDAVGCALGIQQAMAAGEEGERRLALRMGVNLGDVILEGEDLFGEGVNVAARLEAFAEPGQVCLSEDVYRQVRGKVAAEFDDLGTQSFKNIVEPVRVYRVRAAGAGPAPTPSGRARSDKPSIAVLPFDNLSGDPAQDFFADGITEDIITELSRFPDLFVIARNSTFAYKGRRVKIQDVARELKVGYVVEGSARKSGNRVRITVQLIDAETDSHIWAQRYDREIADIFDVQDEIARTIAATLPGRVEAARAERVVRKPPEDMAAYECVLAAKVLHHRSTKADNAAALDLVERAIVIDPRFSQAYAWKGCLIGQAAARGFVAGEPHDLLKRAYESVLTGLALDENDIECHRVLCEAHMARRELDRARTHHERAFALNPNDPRIVAQRGELFTWLGRAEEGVEWLRTAMRLDPFGVRSRAHLLGRALFAARRYAEAVEAYRQTTYQRFEPHADLAACLEHLGRDLEARSEAAETLRLKPDFSTAVYVATLAYAVDSDRDHHRDGLIAAGLPA